MKIITMSSAELDESDIQAVLEVLQSGRIALGPKATEFEESIAKYAGVKYAVAVSSGTAGLHILVRALGIGSGDEVLVPSFTFASTVNVILYERATPVFVDIEPETYNTNTADLERKITNKTKAIIKLPEGEYFQRIEAARGEFGVYIMSKGEKTPYRLKFRSPSMALVSVMDTICQGAKIADLITIGGSMDYVIPDIDR